MSYVVHFCTSTRCWLDANGNGRLAMDGLNLCPQCTTRLASDAIEAGILWGELEERLSASGQPGEGKPANKPGSREPNEPAIEARTAIRHTLASWCSLISEERGINLPRVRVVERLPHGFVGPPWLAWQFSDSPTSMAAYIARHATWLAAHPTAGDAADEFRELAYGRPRSVAYPSGGRRFQVRDATGRPAPCPGHGHCGGTLWALLRRAESLIPSELVCDADDGHRLPATHWLAYGQRIQREAA